MVNLTNIHSLTDFQRNARKHLARMKRTGRPEVLTINGKAAIVVQDAESYQRLMETIDRAEAIAGIQRGLDAVANGETYPVSKALSRIRRKYEIPNRNPSRR